MQQLHMSAGLYDRMHEPKGLTYHMRLISPRQQDQTVGKQSCFSSDWENTAFAQQDEKTVSRTDGLFIAICQPGIPPKFTQLTLFCFSTVSHFTHEAS